MLATSAKNAMRILAANAARSPFRRMATVSAGGSAAGESGRSNLIDEIKQDHKELERYYSNYKNAISDHEEANKWFNQYVWELCRHSVAEELVFYPLMESLDEKGKQYADSARKEQHRVKEQLCNLQKETVMSEFTAKLDKLMEDVRNHMKKEESEELPFLSSMVSEDKLERAAKSFSMKKKIVPTRPHPSVPEKPVALEAALGLLMAPMDKLKDLFTPFPDLDKSSVVR